MKTRQLLPELDLARVATLPFEQRRKALESFRLGRPPYSYKPVRSSLSDLLNLDAGMLGWLPEVSFDKIAAQISVASKNDAEAEANLRVAGALFAMRWRGRKEHFGPMTTSIGEKLVYWSPAVLDIDASPTAMFFNPRKSPLSYDGVRFVFSMMNEQIREANPDFAGLRLAICHFSADKAGSRHADVTFADGFELYSFDELDAMVAETYAIWNEISAGRAEEARKRAGGSGTLI